MNVMHHLIKSESIIGIGPLMREAATDQARASLFKSYRFLFELHLTAHTTTIYSEWLNKLGTADELKQHNKNAEKFMDEYNLIRKQIGGNIQDITHTKRRTDHIKNVSVAYEGFKDILHGLFADLQPTAHCQVPVNDRITKVYESLQHMRDLASTKL